MVAGATRSFGDAKDMLTNRYRSAHVPVGAEPISAGEIPSSNLQPIYAVVQQHSKDWALYGLSEVVMEMFYFLISKPIHTYVSTGLPINVRRYKLLNTRRAIDVVRSLQI